MMKSTFRNAIHWITTLIAVIQWADVFGQILEISRLKRAHKRAQMERNNGYNTNQPKKIKTSPIFLHENSIQRQNEVIRREVEENR